MDSSRNSNSGASGEDKSIESLRRKVRYAEQQQKEMHDSAQKELQRQKKELETIQRDNEQFKQQLNELRASEVTSGGAGALSRSSDARPKSSSGTVKKSKELDSKSNTLAHLEMKLSEVKDQLGERQRQVEENRQLIRERRRDMGGVNITKENHDAVNRQITVLENRLDQSLIKFNDVLRQNKELREQIDTLRGERDVFESIYQRLEGELQERKKEMAFIIEVSNIAYEERDNNAQVLQSLKAFATEEMNTFSTTFKELDELLESDRRTKEQVKQRIQALEKRDQQRTHEEKSKTALKASQLADQQQKDVNPTESQAQAYEEAFAKLRQATDIPDLDQLVQRFLAAEEENFSLFSFVNDLGRTLEKLEKQRSDIVAEIDQIADGDDSDKSRRVTLRALEDKLRSEEKANQQFVDLTYRSTSVLQGIMTAVEGIFNRLDCDKDAIVAKFGVASLTLDSLPSFLAAIEQRAERYIDAWSEENGLLASEGASARGPLVPMEAAQVVVEPRTLPTTGEEADVSDHDDYPLSREELLRKVQKKMTAVHHDKKTLRSKTRGIAAMKK